MRPLNAGGDVRQSALLVQTLLLEASHNMTGCTPYSYCIFTLNEYKQGYDLLNQYQSLVALPEFIVDRKPRPLVASVWRPLFVEDDIMGEVGNPFGGKRIKARLIVLDPPSCYRTDLIAANQHVSASKFSRF